MSGRQDTTQELQEQASEQSVPSEFSRASNRQPPNPTAGTVPPPSIAMSGASLLSKRRLTAPPHLIGIPSEAAYQHPMGGSLPTAGAYTPDTMSSSGSSSGTLPSGSAYTFGAQQQHMPPNWSEQLYQQQPAGHTPNYAYSAPIPPQLYSMRPADGPLGQPLASAPYSSSTNQSDSPEHASYSPEFQQSFFDPFQVKHRRRTTAPQLKILEGQFAANPKPDIPVRKALAEELGMTPREVQVWFQNRRAKSKRLEKKAQQQAEAANKAGTAPGGNDPTQQGPGSAPTVSEHPKLSDRQRSEQQYFEALAKAQQQSSVGPDVHLPPANVVHREWYPPQSALGTASEATMPPPHYMQQRRMTMPANANYNGNDSVPPAYGAGPWTSHDQHIHTGQSAHPSHPYDCPDEHAGQQPFLARLQIPQNDDQIPATPSSTASNNHLYANFRSPLDPFSPAEPPQLEGHSPGMEPATGYFPQAGEAPSSAFGTAENPYMISRRQHSSGSISSNGDSSLGYSTTGTGAMTPTSCLSFSTAASTPVEYLPPGFDANSRRASCPAEFIASFDSMSMPSSAYTGIYASQGQGLAMPPQYANMSPQDNLPQPHLLSPRRHSIATGAAASAPEDLSLFNAASTALSRSPAYIQRTMTPSQLDPIAEAPAVVHQPRPVSAHQAPTFLHQDAAEPDAVEELKSDKELTSPSDAPGSPPRKGQGVQPRKSRSSSSMKSIYKSGSAERLRD